MSANSEKIHPLVKKIYPIYNTMTLKKEQVTDNKHVSDLSQSHIMRAGIKTYNFDFRVDECLVIYVHFNSISFRTVGR